MPLPQYIANEFEAFLKCGIAAHGFLRLSCAGCSQEKIVAFSCKKRGWCPSCCAKRQAEAALRLLDDILPLAPYRQMVLSFPFALRFWMQANKKLFSQIHRIALRAMHRHYEDAARRIGIKSPKSGSVSFTQRAGSALNLNPHLHVLMLDGVFTEISGKAHFRNVPRMTDDDVSRLAESISRKVIALLKRQGLLDKEGSLVAHPDVDPIFRD
ncbi:IS91 family transposase, partial [bacterium]|nr:IS91 family transposase [bacterium]